MASEKKSSLLYILKILQENTDENHTLTYADIGERLYSGFGIEIERKTIASSIDILSEHGYDIVKCGKKGLYLGERDYEDGELLFLIDAIYSSNSMPTKYAKDLVLKLTQNYSRFKKKKFNHLEKFDDGTKTDNKQIFYTIEVLNDAIEQKKKVEFQYGAYDTNKRLKLKGDGKVYKINPYFMVNNRGKYYLVCNYDKYDDISNYKIECIANIKVLDEDVKPIELASGKEKFSIKDYMKEHVYMVSGKTIEAAVKIENEDRVNDFVDWFGKDVYFSKENGFVVANLKVNEEALVYWSLQYGEHVEILKPLETREKIKSIIENMLKKYK